MRHIVVGAGAVGGSIGGRLAQAGQDVVLVARGAHHEALRDHGLRLITPDGDRVHRVPVVDRPEALDLRRDDVLLLCVKTQDTTAVLDAWAGRPVEGGGTAGEVLPVVCAQNGVESERIALRRFRRVYGMCVWLPSGHAVPGEVVAPCAQYTGMLHLGRYPSGSDSTAEAVSAGLEKAGLLAPVVPDVMRWKYAKLLANLANTVGALTGPVTTDAARAVIREALDEGRAVLAAAGIEATPPEEEAAARGDRLGIDPVVGARRGGSSTWQSLSRGTGSTEADYLNGEIALLGRLHSVPTPVNDTLRRVADAYARERRPAGALPVEELTALIEAHRTV